MQYQAASPKEYIAQIPPDHQRVITKLRTVIRKNIPKGFKEQMNYGMIGWVVPHSLYPEGYHCDTNRPLPFINLASQKHFVALYHMGVYSDKKLMQWFTTEYPKHTKVKLDMGKSCIRFKKMDDVPYNLIGQLVSKLTVPQWISLYQKTLKR